MIKKVNCNNKIERLKFQDFIIYPNILHVDADMDAGGIEIAPLHLSAVALTKIKQEMFVKHIPPFPDIQIGLT